MSRFWNCAPGESKSGMLDGRAGYQGRELEHVASVGGKIFDLVAGDRLADVVGVRLNLKRFSLNRDALSHGTDLECSVDPDRVTNIQGDVLLLEGFKALGLDLDLVTSGGKFGGGVVARAIGRVVYG